MRFSNLNKSKHLQKIGRELTGLTYDYQRVGFDHRAMTFCPDGSIGHGAADRELYWDLREIGQAIVLEIYSEEGRTCRLKREGTQSWSGRWEICERMPISLEPWRHRQNYDGGKSLPRSLFIISLPRCLSSRIYHHACQVVGLSQPTWTTDGEILNVDRYGLLPGPNQDTGRKFIQNCAEPHLFRAVQEFLDTTVSANGYGYKDVVQPFAIADWIRFTGFRAVRIRRPIADVAYSMIERCWYYPARLFPSLKDRNVALIRGLILAEKALDSVPAAEISFDEFIHDETVLRKRLEALYGQHAIEWTRFGDENFRRAGEDILRRRHSRKYRAISDLVEQAWNWHQTVPLS
jgi:hypothetical protein